MLEVVSTAISSQQLWAELYPGWRIALDDTYKLDIDLDWVAVADTMAEYCGASTVQLGDGSRRFGIFFKLGEATLCIVLPEFVETEGDTHQVEFLATQVHFSGRSISLNDAERLAKQFSGKLLEAKMR